jgi:carboxymethylenebutenolidase
MTIKVPVTGGEMSAYLSVPKKGKGAGVVVLQEIFGVNESMRKVCDFLASRQFTAICPDLYWRAEAGVELKESEVDRARALRGKMNDDQVSDDINSAIGFLRTHPANSNGSVGVVGYCWGGFLAYLTAVRHKPDAAVAYYGVGIEKRLDIAKNLSCPMLMHYAELDQYGGPEVAAQVRTAYKSDPRVTIYEYPKVGHAFARPGGGHFDARAADLADMRTLSFLVEKLIGHNKAGIM